MNAAGLALQESNMALLEKLLRRHMPGDGDEDLRGFEWYYFWRQYDIGRRSTRIAMPAPARALALSPDIAAAPNGCSLITGDFEGTLQLWRAASRDEVEAAEW
jgi:hypothetical protein